MNDASETYTTPLIERKIKEGYTVVRQRRSKDPFIEPCPKCRRSMYTFARYNMLERLKECPFCSYREPVFVIKRSKKFLFFHRSINAKIANNIIEYIQKKDLHINITSGKFEQDGCREIVFTYSKEYEDRLQELLNNVIKE